MTYDVVIIGAGQAGLSMGYYLRKTDLSFVLLDRGAQIGEAWRSRYDSLVLFSPRSYSALPGLALRGEANNFPTKDDIADYLFEYVQTFDLPVECNTDVKKVYIEKTYIISRLLIQLSEQKRW